MLSLDRAGATRWSSPAEIATWNLDGALVSLSGCGSGSADALPATGLMGLTRACQAAGASAVVASRWPTPDDSGALFLVFLPLFARGPPGRAGRRAATCPNRHAPVSHVAFKPALLGRLFRYG